MDELTLLREIVDCLPKTGDGVPILPGMTVYLAEYPSMPNDVAYIGRRGNVCLYADGRNEYKAECLFSTREAAEAARRV